MAHLKSHYVRSHGIGARVLDRIHVPCNTIDYPSTLQIPFRQSKDVTTMDQLKQMRVSDIEVLKPERMGSAHCQILLKYL